MPVNLVTIRALLKLIASDPRPFQHHWRARCDG